jgi:hypothetical protein
MAQIRDEDLLEVDAFLASPKTLIGPPPEWGPSSRTNDLETRWHIQEESGLIRAHFRFRCPKSDRASPSVSLILNNQPIWRVDFASEEVSKLNMHDAHELGLPGMVCGSHCHTWSDNREWSRLNGWGQLPYRRPLKPQVRRLDQAYPWLAAQVNVTLEPNQRMFGAPPQDDLFG